MKRLCFIVLSASLIFTSCNHNTPLDKANELIRMELTGNQESEDLYTPIKTELDSAFYPFDEPRLFRKMAELYDMEAHMDTLERSDVDLKMELAEKYTLLTNEIIDVLRTQPYFLGYKAFHAYKIGNAEKQKNSKPNIRIYIFDRTLENEITSYSLAEFKSIQEKVRHFINEHLNAIEDTDKKEKKAEN